MNDQVAGNWANGSFWTIVVFVGAMLLLGVLIWARAKNKVMPKEFDRSEQATRDLYREQDADDKARDG